MPSTDFEYKQQNSKKIKSEMNPVLKPECFLNDSMNSMIIIDSENDEDVNNYHKQNINRSPQVSPRKSALASPVRLSVKKKFKAAPRSPPSIVEKKEEVVRCRKLNVFIENICLRKILTENKNLKLAEYIWKEFNDKNDVQKIVNEVSSTVKPVVRPPLVVERNVKKLRSKSKTFPQPVVSSQPPPPSSNNGLFILFFGYFVSETKIFILFLILQKRLISQVH